MVVSSAFWVLSLFSLLPSLPSSIPPPLHPFLSFFSFNKIIPSTKGKDFYFIFLFFHSHFSLKIISLAQPCPHPIISWPEGEKRRFPVVCRGPTLNLVLGVSLPETHFLFVCFPITFHHFLRQENSYSRNVLQVSRQRREL